MECTVACIHRWLLSFPLGEAIFRKSLSVLIDSHLSSGSYAVIDFPLCGVLFWAMDGI